MHLRQKGSRESDAEMRLHDLVQSGRIERPDVEVAVATCAGVSPQLVQQRALKSRAAGEQDADALGPQSPRRVRKRRSGGRVEPLHVVDGDEKIAGACEPS